MILCKWSLRLNSNFQLKNHAFEFGDAGFILISLTVAGKSALGVLVMELAPLDDGVWV
jgi:hypothetical protein